MKKTYLAAIRSATSRAVRRIGTWLQGRMPVGITLMMLAVTTGTLAGVAAWALKYTIGHLARCTMHFAQTDGPNWFMAVVPLIGIMLAVCYQHFVVHESLEHGTNRVRRDLASRQYYMRRSLCYQPLLASMLTLGFGGSAGAEGPIATAGAAIGSNVGRIFNVSPDMVRILIGCGAGAGIAGIFKSPVGGALFTLEVLRMKYDTMSVLALIIASICGSLTCYMLTDFSFDVLFLPASFFDPRSLGWVVLLGIFCGAYSVYYSKITDMLHRFFSGIRSVWLRGIAGGAILGLCIFMFPAMYGEGYGVVTQLVNDETFRFVQAGLFAGLEPSALLFIILAAGVLLLKVFATIATNSSGGVAGDFAPTIFAGAFAGLFFAWSINYTLHIGLSVPLFCLFGMAGVFAGIIHAPLMAIFLVAEMVGNGYGFFLPLTVTAAFSYLTVKLITPASRYRGADHDDLAALLHTSKSAADTPVLPRKSD